MEKPFEKMVDVVNVVLELMIDKGYSSDIVQEEMTIDGAGAVIWKRKVTLGCDVIYIYQMVVSILDGIARGYGDSTNICNLPVLCVCVYIYIYM